ncbi:uncharacterized protein LOC111636269 isoform X2 [Centruroides sculpturatus]|uniref:uncharacterized protein LOC111636269 isoform X2 n=1 Tax=Centruroides sculpturatus TaxID=218467 RepID=UPI000C6CA8C1|nr:uncharacterized protein LOC111636269 isoform X2 [Centruroides sculpturatus]
MATTTRQECVAVIALLAISLGAFVINKKRTSRRRRRWQVRPVNINRPLCQFSLFRRMKNIDFDEFFKYTRMNVDLFHELLRHLWRRLYKPHGRAINPEMKLALTLKYLAQGGSIQSMAWDYNIGKCTARKIILELGRGERFHSSSGAHNWQAGDGPPPAQHHPGRQRPAPEEDDVIPTSVSIAHF